MTRAHGHHTSRILYRVCWCLLFLAPALMPQARISAGLRFPVPSEEGWNAAEASSARVPQEAREAYSAQVVDAETGEELPFTQVYICEGRGTVANSEGQFCIDAHPQEVLTITCMGYQRVRLKAADLPHTLRLTPATTEMREVTVVASENILKQVVQQMEADYQAHKNVYTYYYMRQTYRMDDAVEMAEAYFTASSANNLRQVEFMAGRMFHEKSNERKLVLDFSNIHASLSLAPMIKDEAFWQETIIPLNQKRFRNRYNYEDLYQTSITAQADQDGRRILCIHIQPQEGKKQRKPVMTGDLYVRADNLHPIGFKGRIDGLRLESSLNGEKRTAKARIDINIAYSRAQGYNKVESISTHLRGDGIDSQTTAYNVANLDIPDDADSRHSENLLVAIWHTRKDAAWWQKNIILPTKAEQRLMRENGITPPSIITPSNETSRP